MEGTAAAREGRSCLLTRCLTDCRETRLVTLKNLLIAEPEARGLEGIVDYISLDNPVAARVSIGGL